MAATLARPTSDPMGAMNMTPLIDVLLVLLVMFIITIPIATHTVDIDLPACDANCELPPLDTITNKVTIDRADSLAWNGHPVTIGQLAQLLVASRSLPVEPELRFEPAAQASYEASARTLRTIRSSGVTKFGFVGNERYQSF